MGPSDVIYQISRCAIGEHSYFEGTVIYKTKTKKKKKKKKTLLAPASCS